MPAHATPSPWSRLSLFFAAGAGLVALAVGFELVRPFVAGPVGFDSAASVAYFERIAAGRHLESFVTATPKPALTVVFGVLDAVTGDWRSISWATIGAFAACVALGSLLAWRVGGPLAGVFAGIALLGSRTLLSDVVISYAVPWAMVGWLLAGLALVADKPRPTVAGIVLGLAALARLETLVVVGLALVVVLATARPVRRAAPARTWRLWLIGLGLLAIPVMLVHDWLLTGDPFFWVSVSQRFSTAAPQLVMTPVQVAGALLGRYAGMAILTVLAVVGFGVLARRRQWALFVGALGLSLGVAAFLELLALRGTYVSPRYFAAIDMALVLAASVGAAAIVEAGWRRARRVRPTSGRVGGALMVVLTVVLAVAAIWPVASLNGSFRSSATSQRLQAEHADRVLPIVAQELADHPGDFVLLVPTLQRPRFAVDLDLPLDHVSGVAVASLTLGDGFLPSGDVIYHDRLTVRVPEAYAVLEVSEPTTIGDVTLVPLLADPEAGIWLLRLQR